MGDTIVHVNELLFLDFEITNTGTTTAGGTIESNFYLSSGSSFDEGDTYFGQTRFFLDREYDGRMGLVISKNCK